MLLRPEERENAKLRMTETRKNKNMAKKEREISRGKLKKENSKAMENSQDEERKTGK